jgi:hypothetical protein
MTPDKGCAGDSARSRIILLAIDGTNGGVFISVIERDIAFHLLLCATDHNGRSFGLAIRRYAMAVRTNPWQSGVCRARQDLATGWHFSVDGVQFLMTPRARGAAKA